MPLICNNCILLCYVVFPCLETWDKPKGVKQDLHRQIKVRLQGFR